MDSFLFLFLFFHDGLGLGHHLVLNGDVEVNDSLRLDLKRKVYDLQLTKIAPSLVDIKKPGTQ